MFPGMFTVPSLKKKVLEEVKNLQSFWSLFGIQQVQSQHSALNPGNTLYGEASCQANGNWKCCASTVTGKPGQNHGCVGGVAMALLGAGHRTGFKEWNALQKR